MTRPPRVATRTPKYRNRAVVVDGIKFQSTREAKRYAELRLAERSGAIRELERQVRYYLAPAVVLDGRKRPALRFYADFVYIDTRTGERHVEDSKGFRTPVYRVKRHLMKALLGIEVQEV